MEDGYRKLDDKHKGLEGEELIGELWRKPFNKRLDNWETMEEYNYRLEM